MADTNMEETENLQPEKLDIELIARQVAQSKANVARWGVNSVVILFALLIIIIIIVAQEVSMFIVAAIAVAGLSYVWFTGWKRGKQLYASFVDEEIVNLRQKPEKPVDTSFPQLTSRELQVLNFIAKGFANKQIAIELGISENTVKGHISNILSKLHLADRTQAAAFAWREGIVRRSDS